MTQRLWWVALIVVPLLSISGTAVGAPNKEHQQLMADIRMLQEQQQQLQILLGQLGEALKSMSARLDARLEDQISTTRKAFADHKLIVDSVASDLRVVRERVDETNVRITSLSQEMEALRLAASAAARPPTPEPDPTAVAGGPEVAPPVPPAPPAAPPSLGVSPQRLYETAWADYAGGQWQLAIAGFETYLRTFSRSELADEAQYYIGETYYADAKFDQAVDAYDEVIKGFSGTNSVPQAYYKRGLALERLGQTPRARESYETVIKDFPDSDAARLAKQALDRLNRSK